jgi:ubiquinone/menaquinone biosynthesis C-methylase UbiE
MISRSDDYLEYCRETARHARDLHDLALRGRDKKEITRLIHEHIVEAVGLRSGDDLVDIGCGDGTLLRMAREVSVCSALGLLATEEEVALLRRTGLNVRQGLTDRLPVPDASASVVVCNSVLLVVPREKIPASLREICRIAKPGARIFIGEIPFAEYIDPTPRFNTRRETLSYLYRKHGLRTWFGMLRRMAWEQITGKPVVIQAGTAISFFAPPEEFLSLAKDAGLEIVRYWQSDYPKTRNNYLLRKPEQDSKS